VLRSPVDSIAADVQAFGTITWPYGGKPNVRERFFDDFENTDDDVHWWELREKFCRTATQSAPAIRRA
jgi:hypothetical protein